MSTFMANKGNIVRKWYILDAAGKPLGKTSRERESLVMVFRGIMPRTASCIASSGFSFIRVAYWVSFRPPTQPEWRR